MAKQTIVRAQAVTGEWEVVGADRAAGIWPEDPQLEYDEWGPSRASFTLRRDGSRPWPELGAFTPVEILVGGAVVWDGRVVETPSRIAARSMNVQCEGWQYHLDDDVFDAFYVHNELGAWHDLRSAPTAVLGAASACAVGQVNAGDGAIMLAFPNASTLAAACYVGVYLDLGPGNTAAGMSLDYQTSNNTTGIVLYARGSSTPDSTAWTVNDVVSGEGITSLGASGTRSGAFTTPRRYVHVFLYDPAFAGVTGTDHWIKLTRMQVFAKEDWRAGSSSVLKATDVVNDSLSRGTTLLSTDRSQVVGSAYLAHDEFNQTAGALAGKSLPSGQVWAESGSATGFSVVTASGTANRTTVSDAGFHFATAGTEQHTADAVEVTMLGPTGNLPVIGGPLIRYVSTSLFCTAYVSSTTTNSTLILFINDGVGNPQTNYFFPGIAGDTFRIQLWADSVNAYARVSTNGQAFTPTISCTSPALGGSMASGLVGFTDYNPAAGAATRVYDTFRVSVAPDNTFYIPSFAPDGPQTVRQNWQAVDAFHDWIHKIDVGRVPVYKSRPSAPVIEVGQWSAIDDEDASANSGGDIYNKVIVAGTTPDGRPVRATGTSAASPSGETILSGQINQQMDVGGTGVSSAGGLVTLKNNVPYLLRVLSITRSGGSGGLPIDVWLGWHDFSLPNFNDGDMVQFGAVAVPYVGAPITLVWTPTKMPAAGGNFAIGVSAPGGGTAGSTITVTADVMWGATVADRRGFAKAKVLPVSSTLPPDLVAATVIGSTWANSHRTASFRGSAPVTGDGAVRLIRSGEDVPLERLGSYTGQLVRFGDRADPDSGAWARDGRIVGVTYSPASEQAVMTLDNTRASFEALMARFDLLSR